MKGMSPQRSPALIVLAEFEQPGKLAGPLVQAGFRTETVDSAEAALRFCGINSVDLLITRIVFRYGMTGVELVNRAQAMKSCPRALMITSHRSERLRKVAGFPLPGVPVLYQPIMEAELLETVSSLIPKAAVPKL